MIRHAGPTQSSHCATQPHKVGSSSLPSQYGLSGTACPSRWVDSICPGRQVDSIVGVIGPVCPIRVIRPACPIGPSKSLGSPDPFGSSCSLKLFGLLGLMTSLMSGLPSLFWSLGPPDTLGSLSLPRPYKSLSKVHPNLNLSSPSQPLA